MKHAHTHTQCKNNTIFQQKQKQKKLGHFGQNNQCILEAFHMKVIVLNNSLNYHEQFVLLII